MLLEIFINSVYKRHHRCHHQTSCPRRSTTKI